MVGNDATSVWMLDHPGIYRAATLGVTAEHLDHRRRCDQVLEVIEQQKDPRRLKVASQAIQQRPVAHVPQSYALRDRRNSSPRRPGNR